MAKRNRKTDQKAIGKRLAEGRGQGRGTEYKPWLYIQDVPSQGLATRVQGWKTAREHHFLSKLEWHYFYMLEWSPIITDIREQYPLDLAETLAIAKQLGIRHPTDPRTQQPIVVTTDFLNTVQRGIEIIEHARTVKYKQELSNTRVLQKLEIERVYWEVRNTDWGIVTEDDVDPILAANIKWIHPYREVSDLSPLTEPIIARVEAVLTRRVLEGNRPLRDLTNDCDSELNLRPGASLMIVRHLLANRRWQVDMRKPIHAPERMVLTAIPAIYARQAKGVER